METITVDIDSDIEDKYQSFISKNIVGDLEIDNDRVFVIHEGDICLDQMFPIFSYDDPINTVEFHLMDI